MFDCLLAGLRYALGTFVPISAICSAAYLPAYVAAMGFDVLCTFVSLAIFVDMCNFRRYSLSRCRRHLSRLLALTACMEILSRVLLIAAAELSDPSVKLAVCVSGATMSLVTRWAPALGRWARHATRSDDYHTDLHASGTPPIPWVCDAVANVALVHRVRWTAVVFCAIQCALDAKELHIAAAITTVVSVGFNALMFGQMSI
jgi:hypothetical protein